jgi:hypothetical protein
MIISGLEVMYGTKWDGFEIAIVNPAGKKMVCGFTGFHDPEREKEIREWVESKRRKAAALGREGS